MTVKQMGFPVLFTIRVAFAGKGAAAAEEAVRLPCIEPLYTPVADDVGCKLAVRCTPVATGAMQGTAAGSGEEVRRGDMHEVVSGACPPLCSCMGDSLVFRSGTLYVYWMAMHVGKVPVNPTNVLSTPNKSRSKLQEIASKRYVLHEGCFIAGLLWHAD